MTEGPIRQTAEIIPFPMRQRLDRAAQRSGARRVTESVAAVADVDSGWYHAAAIQEEVRKYPPR